jgi:hypothetical protein
MTDTSHYDQILFQERLRAAETESDYKLFAMFHPQLSVDGDQWCCLYGSDLQSGIAGFGKSPVDAIRHWNAEWYKELPAADGGE